jgi:hypothetical protein
VNRLTARVVILLIGSKRSDLASSFKDVQRNSLDVRLRRRVQRVAATLQSLRKDGVFRMGYRRRIYFTENQKARFGIAGSAGSR